MSVVKMEIRRGAYFDSVTLMRISADAKKIAGVTAAVVGMGTDYNIDSLKRLGMWTDAAADVTPSDLMLAISADDDKLAAEALVAVDGLLKARQAAKSETGDWLPSTLAGAIKVLPEANVVLISVPGAHAAREARQALEAGLHVMLFSDNVSLEEELALKEFAVGRELLVMGPDCGTAILNGVPLAFANVVRRGTIGVVAASGTGLQEFTSLVHRFGAGISQAIGVGGRDLSDAIGGRMTLLAVRALAADPQTRVLALVSKPPAPQTLEKLLVELKSVGKPVVVYFIGAPADAIRAAGFMPASHLEDAARQASQLALGRDLTSLVDDAALDHAAEGITLHGSYLRGLYSGGTLCDEAQRRLLPVLNVISSNTPISGGKKLTDIHQSEGHTIVDLGDDDFTRGRAHPMIDPTARQERLAREIADPSVGMILLDVVLGYGSHPDMAGELASTIRDAGAARMATGQAPLIAAAICGTEDDPQDFAAQVKTLEAVGVKVFPAHAALCAFAARVMGANR